MVAIYVIVVRKCNSRRDEDNDVFSNDIELQTPNAQLQEVPLNKFLVVFNSLLFSFRMILITTELLFKRIK